MTSDGKLDNELAAREQNQLFPAETTGIAFQKNKYIRRFQLAFIDMFFKTVKQEETNRLKPVSS